MIWDYTENQREMQEEEGVCVCVCWLSPCVMDSPGSLDEQLIFLLFTVRHSQGGSRKHLRLPDEKDVGNEESTSEQSLTSSITKKDLLSLRANESDSASTSNVQISDDSTGQGAGNGAVSPTTHRKTVAIDMSQNECFTHRLLPVVSPEFDNFMDQVYTVYRHWIHVLIQLHALSLSLTH